MQTFFKCLFVCYLYLRKLRPHWKWYIYVNCSSTRTCHIILYVIAWGGGIVKRSLRYLYCNKHKEANMNHSDVQKYICCKNGINKFNFSSRGSHKSMWIHMFYVSISLEEYFKMRYVFFKHCCITFMHFFWNKNTVYRVYQKSGKQYFLQHVFTRSIF